MRIIITGLFLLLTVQVYAQNYTNRNNATGKVKKIYEKATELNRSEDWDDALKQYDKLLERAPDFIDAYLAKAAIYYDQEKYEQAVAEFEKALNIDEAYDPRAWYRLALTELNLDRFEAAAQHFDRFIAMGDRSESLINRAKKYAADAKFAAEAVKNPVPFEPVALNNYINTEDPEYLPALTADGENLIFTRRVNGRQEDLFISSRVDGDWQAPVPLAGINTPTGSEGTQSISADGKFLVFTACGRGRGGCDLYYSTVKDGRWTPAQNIGPPINTGAWDSQPSISANGKALFFSSERKGGQGGRDIWVSYLKSNGTWGELQNLGPQINTSADEASPFIHPDGQTLYFHSNGHPGMGGFDLYYSKLQADQTWSEPVNLGYPINTRGNEGALIVSLDGKTAYFASDKKLSVEELEQSSLLAGDADIYQFELYKAARPEPVTYVKAKVYDAVTKQPLTAVAEISELGNEDNYLGVRTDEAGSFLLCLTAGKDYALNVNAENYLFYSDNFALSQANSIDRPFLLDIPLTPIPAEKEIATIEKSKPIILKNVFFETGSAELKPISLTELNKLKKLLDQNPAMRVQINGHTDNVGSEEDNLQLSKDRAKAVYRFLIEQGIAESRLQYKGFGENMPIATNETEEGRQLNRRTEFVPF